MEQYISKAAIEEWIKKEMKQYATAFSNMEFKTYEAGLIAKGQYRMLQDILSFLNALKVKKVDLENSMVCKVGWCDGFLLDYTEEQQDVLLEKIGANVGDKVRVILIKE